MLNEIAEDCAKAIAEALDHLSKLPPNRETALTKTKLEEAQMWFCCARPAVNQEG